MRITDDFIYTPLLCHALWQMILRRFVVVPCIIYILSSIAPQTTNPLWIR
jgi:hypothetical protein